MSIRRKLELIAEMDRRLRAEGLPTYREMVLELGQALRTLDRALDRAQCSDKHLYAAVARENYAEAVRVLGNPEVVRSGNTIPQAI